MLLSKKEILDQLNKDLTDWRFIDSKIIRTIKRNNNGKHLGYLVKEIWDIAEKVDHHPDILLTYSEIKITLFTHDESGITLKDIDFARFLDQKLKQILIS